MTEAATLSPNTTLSDSTGTDLSGWSDAPLAIHRGFALSPFVDTTGSAGSTETFDSDLTELVGDVDVGVMDVFADDRNPLASKVAELFTHWLSLTDHQLARSLIQPLLDDATFKRGAEGLRQRLIAFPDITKDWPQFSQIGFPQASIDAALSMFADAWEHVGRRGRAAIQTAFCGPSEDGAVNCQWRRDGLFLGLSVGPDGLPEAYFCDERSGEEFEGEPDLASFVDWIERF